MWNIKPNFWGEKKKPLIFSKKLKKLEMFLKDTNAPTWKTWTNIANAGHRRRRTDGQVTLYAFSTILPVIALREVWEWLPKIALGLPKISARKCGTVNF